MVWSRGSWVGALIAAAALFAVVAAPAAGREPKAHGRELLAQYRLPPEMIARYAALAAGTAVDDSSRQDSKFADRSPWVGPEQRAGAGRNPYTLVVTVSGVVRTTGDVQSHWQAGWELYESADASREVLMALSRLARKGVAAGQRLTLTTSSAPLSFRGERKVAPMLGLVQSRNLDIDDVRLEVWSGTAPMAWPALPAAALAVAGMAAALGFGLWALRHRLRLVPAPAQEAQTPSEPPPDQGVTDDAAPQLESAAVVDPPPAPTRDHELRVFESLHEVLRGGLGVETVLDETRMQAARKKKRKQVAEQPT